MKNLKLSLLAIALIAGVGAASAYNTAVSCGQQTLVLKNGATAAFIAPNAEALDQTLDNYEPRSGSYSCTEQPIVCTFYLDPVDQKIKQCEEGTFVQ